MENIAEKNKALDRLKDLLAYNSKNNASKGEIEAAALLIRKILDKHDLTLADVTEKEMYDGVRLEESRPAVSHNHNIYLGRLASSLALAFECRLIYSQWLDKGDGSSNGKWRKSYKFVGYETDVLSCVYFFDYLRERLLALANEEICKSSMIGSSRYIFTNSFIIGAANAIYERLRKKPVVAAQGNGTALVVMKKRAVDSKVKEIFTDLRSSRSRGGMANNAGLMAGKSVGASIALNRGIGSAKARSQRLQLT